MQNDENKLTKKENRQIVNKIYRTIIGMKKKGQKIMEYKIHLLKNR